MTKTKPKQAAPKGAKGIGSGPTNLAGARGISPVLRVRVTEDLLARIGVAAEGNSLTISDWVRRTLEENC